ncbi:MAG: OmpH family outer membrane protein [Bacteroidetes bacterium]|nr:OmpH family outer membrane protein [Bacteroidota bacterium]NCQ11056.1 OmpH family outer membrane protein [Bacteroidota bacterium]
MIQFKKLIGIALTFVCLMSMQISAQSLKVGYANPDQIIGNLPSFKKIQQEMESLVKTREASLLGKRDSLAKSFQSYQELSANMSTSQREAEETRLQGLNDELQELSNSVRAEVQRKQAELLQPVYSEIQKAIDEVAKELKLDFVFNKVTSNGDTIILFANDTASNKLDITEKVIAKLTKK